MGHRARNPRQVLNKLASDQDFQNKSLTFALVILELVVLACYGIWYNGLMVKSTITKPRCERWGHDEGQQVGEKCCRPLGANPRRRFPCLSKVVLYDERRGLPVDELKGGEQ